MGFNGLCNYLYDAETKQIGTKKLLLYEKPSGTKIIIQITFQFGKGNCVVQLLKTKEALIVKDTSSWFQDI